MRIEKRITVDLSLMTIVHAEPTTDAPLTIGGRSFRSRLMVGTG
jgi:hypothetical protein